MSTDQYIYCHFLDLILVRLDQRFSVEEKNHLCAQMQSGEIKDYKVTLTVEKGTRRDGLPHVTPLTQCFSVTEDAVWEKARYKFSAFEFTLTGLREMVDIRLSVEGDLPSRWTWPFRVFGLVLKLIVGHYGYSFIHAAGLDLGNGHAAMVVGPSGSGKSLTYLHWLCGGRAVYHDDVVLIRDRCIYPHVSTMCYWGSRYRGGRGLPQAMPKLDSHSQKRLQWLRLLRVFTAGKVDLALSLDVSSLWPHSQARTPGRVASIIQLSRENQTPASCTPCDNELLRNLLLADLRFTSMPVLRWIHALTSVSVSHGLSSWEARLTDSVNALIADARCWKIGVKEAYDSETFALVEKTLCQ